MSNDIECPYCGCQQKINHDDGSYGCEEDTNYSQECIRCDKTFGYNTHISFFYAAFQADCLNGGEHKWYTGACHPEFMTMRRCETCDEEEFVHTNEEREKMSAEYFKSLKEKEKK
jgi:hypothetical protein